MIAIRVDLGGLFTHRGVTGGDDEWMGIGNAYLLQGL
jgi:hypothetical protein